MNIIKGNYLMRKKRFNIRTLAISTLAIYFAVIFIKQEVSSIRISGEIEKASIQLKVLTEKGEQLKEQLDLAKSDPEKFGEKQVRERLGYIKEHETPVMSRSGSK